MQKKWPLIVAMVVVLVVGFSFQNCSPYKGADFYNHVEAPGTEDLGSSTEEGFNQGQQNNQIDGGSPVAGNTPNATSSGQKVNKIGINIGIFATQKVVDSLGNVGGWYYNYSPHPNRDDANTKYNTVNWANTYNKEFVPMIQQFWFKLGPQAGGCPIIAEYGANPCTVDQMVSIFNQTKKLFKSTNQPRYLIVFNEPHISGIDSPDRNKYSMEPIPAAKAFGKIQTFASRVGLKVLAPNAAVDPRSIRWMGEFFRACYDLRNATENPCRLEDIYAFQNHEYQCASNFWTETYINGGFKNNLVAELGNYGGYDWSSFVRSKTVWFTETNCNWDPDFLAAQGQGQFVRSQQESCLRATGQKPGFGKGSLFTLMQAPNSSIERISWWNTYADPDKNSDGNTVSASSRNRITAARLMDGNGNWTPAGRALKQAYLNPNQLLNVNCTDTAVNAPATLVGLFKVNAGIYHGYKDFYCVYPNMATVTKIWGANWQQLSQDVSARPSQMTDAGVCGPLQGVHRDGSNFFYTFKQNYTCWLNSTTKLRNWAGIPSGKEHFLPSAPLSSKGLDGRMITSKLCE